MTHLLYWEKVTELKFELSGYKGSNLSSRPEPSFIFLLFCKYFQYLLPDDVFVLLAQGVL